MLQMRRINNLTVYGLLQNTYSFRKIKELCIIFTPAAGTKVYTRHSII